MREIGALPCRKRTTWSGKSGTIVDWALRPLRSQMLLKWPRKAGASSEIKASAQALHRNRQRQQAIERRPASTGTSCHVASWRFCEMEKPRWNACFLVQSHTRGRPSRFHNLSLCESRCALPRARNHARRLLDSPIRDTETRPVSGFDGVR